MFHTYGMMFFSVYYLATDIKSLRDNVFGIVKVDVESPKTAIEEAKRVVEAMILD